MRGQHLPLVYRKQRPARDYEQQIWSMGRKPCAQCDIASFKDAERVPGGRQGIRQPAFCQQRRNDWDGVSWKMSEEQWDRVLEVT
jgi:3-oxoacyl-[acyl-carrier protein] reductase